MSDTWATAQQNESYFWKDCVKTFDEEKKQLTIYAPRMKLSPIPNRPFFDLEHKSIIDIGSGPVSLLLKCINFEGYAVDPLMNMFPKWVRDRYRCAGITPLCKKGEELDIIPTRPKFDEAWIYNVLQHTDDPEKVIKNARKIAHRVRIFEWIEVPTDVMHIHVLHASTLDLWLGKKGMVENVEGNNIFGLSYYNVI